MVTRRILVLVVASIVVALMQTASYVMAIFSTINMGLHLDVRNNLILLFAGIVLFLPLLSAAIMYWKSRNISITFQFIVVLTIVNIVTFMTFPPLLRR